MSIRQPVAEVINNVLNQLSGYCQVLLCFRPFLLEQVFATLFQKQNVKLDNFYLRLHVIRCLWSIADRLRIECCIHGISYTHRLLKTCTQWPRNSWRRLSLTFVAGGPNQSHCACRRWCCFSMISHPKSAVQQLPLGTGFRRRPSSLSEP